MRPVAGSRTHARNETGGGLLDKLSRMGDSLRVQLLRFVVIIIVLGALILGFLRWQYVDVVAVNDDAMAPTIFGGDEVLVWRGHDFDHGDIVLCRHPRIAGAWVIGRVVGYNGMNVEFRREQLTINGQIVARNFSGEVQFEDQRSHAQVRFSWGTEELGEVDHLFMERPEQTIAMRPVNNVTDLFLLTDNRTWIAGDSRTFGPVQAANCQGTVFMRWSPGGRAPAEFAQGHLDILD